MAGRGQASILFPSFNKALQLMPRPITIGLHADEIRVGSLIALNVHFGSNASIMSILVKFGYRLEYSV